jgi:Group II intron, maturase-specific domain/N-terminal domain of reverse transcriptase
MSKEILLNFNTIFWVTINKNKNYSYVTRLKSRIYQASINKEYEKLQKLQLKLLTSFAAKTIVIDYILKTNSIYFFKNNKDLEKLCIICSIHNTDQIIYYYLNSKQYIFTQELISIIELINYFLLLLILEPQWIARRTFKNIPFIVLINPYQLSELFQIQKSKSIFKQIYSININYKLFIHDLSKNYILTRFNLEHFFNLKIQKILSRYLYKENSFKLKISTLYMKNFFTRSSLESYIGLNIFFYLYSEALFISNSKLFNSYNFFINKKIKIYSYGLEVMIYHCNSIELNLWSRLLSQLMYYYIYDTKLLYLTTSMQQSHLIDFCNYSIILTKNNIIWYFPNKLAQFNLLQQIKYTIINCRGNSATNLIDMLNSILTDWVTYFKYTNQFKIFVLIDYLIYLKVWRWIYRKHPKWSKQKLKNKYFTNIMQSFLYRKYRGWIFNDIIINDFNKKNFLLKLTIFIHFLHFIIN